MFCGKFLDLYSLFVPLSIVTSTVCVSASGASNVFVFLIVSSGRSVYVAVPTSSTLISLSVSLSVIVSVVSASVSNVVLWYQSVKIKKWLVA